MSNESQSPFTDAIKQSAGLTIGVGALVLLTGLLAMGAPLVASLSLAIMVGSMLIIGGIGQLIIALKADRYLLVVNGSLEALKTVDSILSDTENAGLHLHTELAA
jgi:uncharacterized membrane protein HdeD (DUF308 family)